MEARAIRKCANWLPICGDYRTLIKDIPLGSFLFKIGRLWLAVSYNKSGLGWGRGGLSNCISCRLLKVWRFGVFFALVGLVVITRVGSSPMWLLRKYDTGTRRALMLPD
ncbi:unnamed protein product [Tuber melanosporum]|uniref:(Perigord truffle) hypothetical protein n=1 Tax=Tuber melanosporum (strain Mel28) TaxID=656061 RepID=D5GIF0_TUBMM|nr:uncharacterized protein GSTUM_00008457001 [Tuber melanosporum]CAZ84293.1 unnamed protein product [Tuber melanosporum]